MPHGRHRLGSVGGGEMTTKWARGVASLLVMGMAAASCSSSNNDDGGAAEGTSDVVGYLVHVTEVEQARASMFREVGETLNRQYSDRQGFFDAVEAIDPSPVDELIEGARALDPPSEHADDHAAWVATFDSAREALEEVQTAVGDDDFVGVLTAGNRVFIDVETFIVGSGPKFCRALVEGGAGELFRSGTPCTDPDELPGGEYGLTARRAALREPSEISPLIGPKFQSGTDEEMIEYLDTVQPTVDRTFREILETLRSLEPPQDLAADHEAVITYFEGISRIAGEVTDATKEGDDERLQRLFADSRTPARELDEALSADGGRLFDVLLPPDGPGGRSPEGGPPEG